MNFYKFEFTPLNYMHLSEYDNFETTSPTIYEIVMEDYRLKILGKSSVSNIYDGQANKGHAEVVAAQWKRECVNLTLYKRDVVYSQDFFAKNKLTIAPLEGSSSSFADPIVYDDFKVEENIVSNITAGDEIILKPGVHLLYGSNVSLSITPYCDENSGIDIYHPESNFAKENMNFKEDDKQDLERYTLDLDTNSIHVYPNSFDEYLDITAPFDERILIYSIDGKLIDSFISDKEYIKLNTSTYASGIYIISFESQKKHYRIIKP